MSVFDIAFTGTSLTTGALSRGWQNELLRRLAPMTRHTLRNYDLGMPGSTSAWGLANIFNVVNMRPRAAIMEFAINDVITSNNISPAQFADNLRQMILIMKAWCPDTRLFLMTMNPTVGVVIPGGENLAYYYSLVRSLAVEQGVLLIDNEPLWAGITLFDAPDAVHPTELAVYSILVPNVVRALSPLLSTA